jgi:hypothetical protein
MLYKEKIGMHQSWHTSTTTKPDNNTELLGMQQRAKACHVIGDELFKTSVTGPLLRCLSRDEGRELLS